ncbi:hypothetical protein K0M31_001033 [Melipona bicolor]|uniref:Uncharacterized protein n=1 Tax=Melipona bicolor TaxID=60889 RepID=A0AA40GER1_9HYME|nr:hypothetical protein K0M31_001033 [Melipona bicolor]
MIVQSHKSASIKAVPDLLPAVVVWVSAEAASLGGSIFCGMLCAGIGPGFVMVVIVRSHVIPDEDEDRSIPRDVVTRTATVSLHRSARQCQYN